MLRQKALPTLVRNASSLEQSKLETVTLASHLRPGQISGRSPMFWHWARLARAVRRLAKVSYAPRKARPQQPTLGVWRTVLTTAWQMASQPLPRHGSTRLGRAALRQKKRE